MIWYTLTVMKLLAVLLFLLIFLPSGLAFASGTTVNPSCSPIVGGGQSCVQNGFLEIDKKVKNPATGDYVNNINLDDPLYTPGQEIIFKITITNSSSSRVSGITVKDIFPQLITYVSGDGTYDAKTRTLTSPLNAMNPKDVTVLFITGKIADADKLPPVTCVINQATVTSGKNTSQDNSQICLTKQKIDTSAKPYPINPPAEVTNPPASKGGIPIYSPPQSQTTPPTGPEALAIFGLIPAGALGLWLRKKTK